MKTKKNNRCANRKTAPATPVVQDGEYNVAVFWTEELSSLVANVIEAQRNLVPTRHVKDRIQEYGLPKNCYESALTGSVVEATIVEGNVNKVVTRCPASNSDYVDWCAVVVFKNGKAIVVTMWCNHRYDNHKTLNITRYVH